MQYIEIDVNQTASVSLTSSTLCCPMQARIQEFLVEGDDMDEEKIGRGLGAAVGPQRGPGAEPLVGVKGAKPPMKVTLFSRIVQ
jgi:hypothetical protein